MNFFSGERPWANRVKSDNKIMALLFKKAIFSISKHIEKNTKIHKLIDYCTQVDPKDRPNIKEVKFILQEILFEKNQRKYTF